MSNIGIAGEREQGNDVRNQNCMAVNAIANIVKSSLGPQGLDKMLVDEIGEVTVTNDGATILRQLEVQHPAAKIMVELSALQDKEVGDGTTSVVIMASEFLKRANALIAQKIHPTNIIQGYKLAQKEAIKFLKKNMCVKVGEDGKSLSKKDSNILTNCCKTCMSSKLIGSESDFFSKLVIDAVLRVKRINPITKKPSYPIGAINKVLAHGQSSLESKIIDGMVLRQVRASQLMPTRIENAVIACIDFNLNKFRCKMGVQVTVDDPSALAKIRAKEVSVLKERIQMILDSGVNVILSTMGIDDLAQKLLIKNGVMGIRRIEKSKLRFIARSCGATIVTSLADEDDTQDGIFESFDKSCVGHAEVVYEDTVGDMDYLFIERMEKSTCCTMLLRGPNDFMLDEIDRSIHDAVCVMKRTLESGYVVPGGGACEIALCTYLKEFAKTLHTKAQEAVLEFAQALLVIPKTLTLNAALNVYKLLSKLRMLHHYSQHRDGEEFKKLKYYGLDLMKGNARDNLQAGVLEPAVSKIKCIRFATEAAITILRIDDMIKLAPEQKPQRRR